jgi:hypothetical protein
LVVYVYGDPGGELAKFAYDSLVNEGISRFFWSYEPHFDLSVLVKKEWKDLDSEEFEARAKAEFLLSIKPGDFVAHVNVPIWGEVTIGRVVSRYFFQNDLPEGRTDGRHCLKVENVFTFNRDDKRVYPEISKRLKLRGSHWKIRSKYEKEFFASLGKLKFDL